MSTVTYNNLKKPRRTATRTTRRINENNYDDNNNDNKSINGNDSHYENNSMLFTRKWRHSENIPHRYNN